MEPEVQRQKEMMEAKLNQSACANGRWVLKIHVDDTGTEHFTPEGEGCPNQRRNGSKFCQECSDKHYEVANSEETLNNDETHDRS